MKKKKKKHTSTLFSQRADCGGLSLSGYTCELPDCRELQIIFRRHGKL